MVKYDKAIKPKHTGKRRNNKTNRKGFETRVGEKGAGTKFITRNSALKKLQITLKDFRRLCILKGIYPREPKGTGKKRRAKATTWFHIKDIKFLAHEPLLQTIRDVKIFLRQLKRAKNKYNTTKEECLAENPPEFNLEHLVKERYPTFVSALRDLDDALCMTFLFSDLPSGLTPWHGADMANQCTALTTQWQNYIFRVFALRKVFVSIKGYYFQAFLQGQDITWLVPHRLVFELPREVDFKVMFTFLEFYVTVMKFVLWQLYHSLKLHYPPKIDKYKEAARAGLSMLAVHEKDETEKIKNKTPDDPKLQQQVSAVIANLQVPKEEMEISKQVPEEETEVPKQEVSTTQSEKEKEKDMQSDKKLEEKDENTFFNFQDTEQANVEEEKCKNIFKGLLFMLAREVPQNPLEFVILCGGGKVLREISCTEEEKRSLKITHQICDRNKVRHYVLCREYIQPQWVFDCFNCRALLPTLPYKPGKRPPPHLSPFVDDVKENYIPEQKKVLEKWVARAHGKVAPDNQVDVRGKKKSKRISLEEQHAIDLKKEIDGLSYSANKSIEDAVSDDDNNDEDDNDIAAFLKEGISSITFEPGRTGLNFNGRIVKAIQSGSQAAYNGVFVGWFVLAIDNEVQPDDADIIIDVIQKKKRSGIPFIIEFFKGSVDNILEIGEKVILSNIKKKHELNGVEAWVRNINHPKSDSEEKLITYDITLDKERKTKIKKNVAKSFLIKKKIQKEIWVEKPKKEVKKDENDDQHPKGKYFKEGEYSFWTHKYRVYNRMNRENRAEPETRKLAKSMMTNKNKHLYHRMQFGITLKKEKGDTLRAKRLNAYKKQKKT